jgi:hypothetical protein
MGLDMGFVEFGWGGGVVLEQTSSQKKERQEWNSEFTEGTINKWSIITRITSIMITVL